MSQNLLILGGGSAAFAAATTASRLGWSVTLFNSRLPTGGTCVNVGCVPSKALLRAAHSLHQSQSDSFPGIYTGGYLQSFEQLRSEKDELVAHLRDKKYAQVIAGLANVRLVEAEVELVGPTEVRLLSGPSRGLSVTGKAVLIATGSRPAIPDIPGLLDVPYLTSQTAFELQQLPESLIVLGGRYVALECAQLFSRLGTKVTIVQRSSTLLPTEATNITDPLTAYLRDEGLTVLTGATVMQVSQNGGRISVTLLDDQTISATHLLIATGRVPNTEAFAALHQLKRSPLGNLLVNDYLETSVPGVFAAGDVIDSPAFVYTAAYEGGLAAENIIQGHRRAANYSNLPWVIFTDPQVAGVGLDEREAQSQGLDVEVSVLLFSEVPRCLAARDTRGLIKLVRDKASKRLLGARILGAEASELLMEVAMAISAEKTTAEIGQMFHPYLTLCEAVKLACIAFDTPISTLSCCAH